MATKSFMKNITIKDKAAANSFINALENAEGKRRKIIEPDRAIETIKNKERIRKIFGQ